MHYRVGFECWSQCKYNGVQPQIQENDNGGHKVTTIIISTIILIIKVIKCGWELINGTTHLTPWWVEVSMKPVYQTRPTHLVKKVVGSSWVLTGLTLGGFDPKILGESSLNFPSLLTHAHPRPVLSIGSNPSRTRLMFILTDGSSNSPLFINFKNLNELICACLGARTNNFSVLNVFINLLWEPWAHGPWGRHVFNVLLKSYLHMRLAIWSNKNFYDNK